MPETPPPVSRLTCAALNKRGEPCRSGVRAGAVYCFQHDPERRAEAAAARARGGKHAHSKSAPAPPADLSTAESQRKALEEVIDRVRRGDETVQIARTVLYALSLARPILEMTDIVERLEALEARLGVQR